MNGPYRTIADVPLLEPCTDRRPPRRCLGCGLLAPEPARFAACITSQSPSLVLPPPRRWTEMLYAGLVLALVVSPMVLCCAASWCLIQEHIHAPALLPAAAVAAGHDASPPRHRHAVGSRSGSWLSALAADAHDPGVLRRISERLDAAGVGPDYAYIRLSTVEASARMDALAAGLNVSPVAREGRVIGARLTANPPPGLGLRRGDLITAVNGFSTDSPDGALRAYESGAKTCTAVIELERRGVPRVVVVDWSDRS